jgi:4-amino-4-deoxy-L-arabinose transferase-like glycosyltransferase
VCICLVALTVRLLYLAEWAGNPLFHTPMGDELNFHDTARSLLGMAPPVETFLFQPLYSFFLTGVYGLFGIDVGVVRTIQLFIGVVTCLLFYGLGREIGGRWTGRISALLIALYGPMVFFEGTLLAPALVVPLLAGAFWALVAASKRDKFWLAAPAGLLLGVAMMGRPNLGAMVPVAAVWLFLRSWPLRRRLWALGLSALALAAGLSPAWIHNASRGEKFTLVSSSGGINFYIGNNPQATGRFHIPRGERFTGFTHWDFQENTRALAERAQGRKLTPSEVSSYWYRRGLDFWRRQPLPALRLTGKKLLLALNHQEMPVHHPYVFAQEVVPILGWLLSFGVVFPFAFLGIWPGGRRRFGTWLLVGCAAAYLLTLLAFFVADRFRVVLLPVLMPLAGLGMLRLAEVFQKQGLPRAWPCLLTLGLCFGLTQIPMTSSSFNKRAIARGYNRMGKAEGDRNDLRRAEECFRRALRLAGPEDGTALMNLGKVYELRGDIGRARDIYRRVAARDRENRAVRVFLARMAESSGMTREAIQWWEEVANLLADPRPARNEIERLRASLDSGSQ